jgi:Asp-tRNA(Asn)/Glu-tRNA(Gln) amidotransferase A subunit family amidase
MIKDEFEAWVQIAPREPLSPGPLKGLTFGVKDIIEVRGLAFECGSPIYKGRIGEVDAPIVRMLRERGAAMIGKTQTTAFAYFDPAPTRNPRNPEHTPGGSSSGSAVAVATGDVDFALGTQTQGSILRPASYCGVVGFKPTYGVIPTKSVMAFAPSLDTVGWFSRDVATARRIWAALGHSVEPERPFRFGVPRGLPRVEPPMERAFARLSAREIDLPVPYMELLSAVRAVNDYEGARMHQERWWEHGSRIGRKMAELVERGLAIPEERYDAARDLLESTSLDDVFGQVEVLLTPAAPGPAPRGLSSTGDPIMNAVWTGLGTPAISIPLPVGVDELPVGLQMVAARGNDGLLLAAADRIVLR